MLEPATITLITTSILAIIGAITTNVVLIIKATKTNRIAQASALAGRGRDIKLDRIEVLVDGRYSQVLQELADVKQYLATSSGKHADQVSADAAQIIADDQVMRVNLSRK